MAIVSLDQEQRNSHGSHVTERFLGEILRVL